MEEDSLNTNLVLGVGEGKVPYEVQHRDQEGPVRYHILFPPHGNVTDKEEEKHKWNVNKTDEEDDGDRHADYNEKELNTRKKLRLTKEQSSLLADSFKDHTTLTVARKQELAQQLNLRPRQVEVWFQNRRARTKLKQSEVDSALWKKCCENLSQENLRLKEELQELRSMKLGSSLMSQVPKVDPTTLNMCPSCTKKLEFIATTTNKDDNSSMAFKKLFK